MCFKCHSEPTREGTPSDFRFFAVFFCALWKLCVLFIFHSISTESIERTMPTEQHKYETFMLLYGAAIA